ncbi:hypothetical protein B0T13DRAFT_6955 [Neurospora crassa]|nr:hypothetical protein B0T13DRAFT_6955 [Neurospora crassa]
MKKTLLLCFIHGFKGGESTFGDNYAFTEHLRQLVAADLPKINVNVVVYPKYETRGDLGECVARFRDWLMNKVIDLEVAAGTSSPTIDPSVRVVLVGHSMGGIVAAETAIELSSDKPIHGSTDPAVEDPKLDHRTADSAPLHRPPSPSSLMFPYIQGVLGFDTPYLGIAPAVFAHGVEGHYATASAALSQLSSLTSLLGAKGAQAQSNATTQKRQIAALPAPEKKEEQQRNNGSAWGSWGKIAMVAGAAAAAAAGGAAAYYNRDQITQSVSWATSHLEFVGVLYRREELRRRVAYMVRLNNDLGVGFANFYTRLGRAAGSKEVSMVGTVMGNERTFCVLPKKDPAGDWREAIDNKAKDEVTAHISMFDLKDNPGYTKLAHDARDMIVKWLQNDWYESSNGDVIRA